MEQVCFRKAPFPPLNELDLVIYLRGGNLGKFRPPVSSCVLVPLP